MFVYVGNIYFMNMYRAALNTFHKECKTSYAFWFDSQARKQLLLLYQYIQAYILFIFAHCMCRFALKG